MDPIIGEIKLLPYTFAPRNYAYCHGQLYPIAQNTALFSLVGTTYGGDGRTTFGVPNFRGKTAVHWGTAPGLSTVVFGQYGGVNHVTLAQSQIPVHDHDIYFSRSPSDTPSPMDKYMGIAKAANGIPVRVYDSTVDTTKLVPMDSSALATAGRSQAHENMQPYQVISYMIALDGLWPQRN